MHPLDGVVLVGYLVGIVLFANGVIRPSRSADAFMAAGRALPGWAVGLSIFGSYVSSLSFFANPGQSFSGTWNRFVFTLATPIGAWVAVRWFVPFYRSAGGVSAYEHLERRFGAWARVYAVACFLLVQVGRMGAIVYLLALALFPLTGWPVWATLVLTGGTMTLYTLAGGMEAVVWAGVVQSAVLLCGLVTCVLALLIAMPMDLGTAFDLAFRGGKFSLADPDPSIGMTMFWVVLANAIASHMQNFGVDQSYVQRYVTAKSDADAKRSVWLGAAMYMPTAAGFFLIGTLLFVLYDHPSEGLPDGVAGDQVFPHFIATHLPPGLAGLVIASVFAAAMDSNLNSMATLTLHDLYRRHLRPGASDRESLRVLRLAVVVWGTVGTIAGLAMIGAKSALDEWWRWASVFSGGVLGLFLLARLSSRVSSRAALAATLAGVFVIIWMTFSPRWFEPGHWLRSPFHDFLVIVGGTLTILVVGLSLAVRKGG